MSDTARAIRDVVTFPREWEKKADDDGSYAIACGLYVLAAELHYLGNGDVNHHGAIEAIGMHIGEKLDGLIEAINELKDIVVTIERASE